MHTVHTTSQPSSHPSRTGSTSRFAVRCLTVIAILATSVAVAPSPTSADTGGCGAAWTLVDVDELRDFILAANPPLKELREADETFDDAVTAIFAAANRNGYDGDEYVDEYVCVRTNKGNAGQDRFYLDPTWPDLEGHYVITNVNDNNSRPL